MRMLLICGVSLLTLAAAGCHQTAARGPEGNEIKVASPESVVVRRGDRKSVNIGVHRAGFTDPVMATVSDLPAGVRASTPTFTIEGGSANFDLIASSLAPSVVNHKAKVTVSRGEGELEATHHFSVTVTD